ncbi:MAG: HAD family hydrolase [Dehalococcoidia bacterium]|nr:HAD family hydrolase [Dehalococcoidia bacterium]
MPARGGKANRAVFPAIFAQHPTWGTDPMTRIRTEATETIGAMAEYLGMARPAPDQCFDLLRAADVHVAATAEAAFPFAADAIRALAARLPVHTATGNPSWRVEALLTGLGVRELVGVLAGPDLVGISKGGPLYYERVVALAGADPSTALIVDDSVTCIAWAAEAGAQTAHITSEACPCPATRHLATLAEVPALELIADR